MHGTEANNFRLKSGNSVIKKTKYLLETKEQSKIMQWTNKIRDENWASVNVLFPGNQLELPIWRTLNRMRTEIGRAIRII